MSRSADSTRLHKYYRCAILLSHDELNAVFNHRETVMRTLNKDTLRKMEEYISETQRKECVSPSYRDIMHAVGMRSLNLVQRYVFALEKQGKLQRTSKGSIALPERFQAGRCTVAPLVGNIACGVPSFAEENIEASYALPVSLFGEGELYLLRTHGDSMIDAGIEKNDLIVVRRQSYADDGQIVVALIDGEATLKRIFHRGGKIVLHPENKQMQDIIVDTCEIQGVLVSCIKMY